MPRRRKNESVPLDDEYRYQLKKRSSWDFTTGLPSVAASGDRKAIKKCAGMAAVLVERLAPPGELIGVKEWLLSCLWEIETGRSPDEAFGWKRGSGGRPREFEILFRQWLIGQHMDGLVKPNGPHTIDAAAEIVADARDCSTDTAKECLRAFRGMGQTP